MEHMWSVLTHLLNFMHVRTCVCARARCSVPPKLKTKSERKKVLIRVARYSQKHAAQCVVTGKRKKNKRDRRKKGLNRGGGAREGKKERKKRKGEKRNWKRFQGKERR